MNLLPPHAIGAIVLCAVSCPTHSSEQSTKLVITEGNSIGYATVVDALATLESKGLTPAPGLNGDLTFVEPDHATAWKFLGKDDPAYPSVVRYVYTRSGGVLHAEVTILCEAAAGRCEKFRSDIRDNLAQLSKRMAGDASAKCSVNENTMQCGAEAERKQANQQIYIQLGDDGSCTLDNIAIPCPDLGRKIRAEHPSDDPQVSVCASAQASQDFVEKALGALREDHLSPVLGCPPHSVAY
jgi:biopolymer transport protein ExbD